MGQCVCHKRIVELIEAQQFRDAAKAKGKPGPVLIYDGQTAADGQRRKVQGIINDHLRLSG